jgi:vacuolar-type H+-ATPase subunit H
MTITTRMQALLDVVEAERSARCRALIEQARSEAAATLGQARAQARTQIRELFADERQRARARIAAAQAELHTRQRLHAQRHVEALLALGWQRLPAALRARWHDGEARASWVRMALDAARAALPQGIDAGDWTATHGEDWPQAEREAFAAQVQGSRGAAPRFATDARIDAGLRIAAGGNGVDATLAGLLADRDEIGGRLIGELEGAT